MNKLVLAANDGIEPASYSPLLANPLACFGLSDVALVLRRANKDRSV